MLEYSLMDRQEPYRTWQTDRQTCQSIRCHDNSRQPLQYMSKKIESIVEGVFKWPWGLDPWVCMNQLYRSTSFFELPTKLAGRLRWPIDSAEDGVLDLDSKSPAAKTCFNLSKWFVKFSLRFHFGGCKWKKLLQTFVPNFEVKRYT